MHIGLQPRLPLTSQGVEETTALHVAALSNNALMVRVLLQEGFDPDARDKVMIVFDILVGVTIVESMSAR